MSTTGVLTSFIALLYSGGSSRNLMLLGLIMACCAIIAHAAIKHRKGLLLEAKSTIETLKALSDEGADK